MSDTKIFARTVGKYGFLVYAMRLDVDTDVAMILPIPVEIGGGTPPEKKLSFIDYSGYPDFFEDLARGFPVARKAPTSSLHGKFAVASASPLPVETIGSFEASFVPTLADFERLDERFRLAPGVWEKLPGYADHGFAVFRLRPGADRIHPMAFRFWTRHLDRIFFPTVHVHDGEVHETAAFDHHLYYQASGDRSGVDGEERSTRIAADFVSEARARALVRMADPIFRQRLVGERPNRDTFVF